MTHTPLEISSFWQPMCTSWALHPKMNNNAIIRNALSMRLIFIGCLNCRYINIFINALTKSLYIFLQNTFYGQKISWQPFIYDSWPQVQGVHQLLQGEFCQAGSRTAKTGGDVCERARHWLL